ncbi:MAG: fluoride efflux transporter CrcB [Fibrobacteria bacterium]
MQWILVGIGGGLGSVLRFWVQTRVRAAYPGILPLGTLGVNLMGSLIIGFLAGWYLNATQPSQLKLFLMVGLLGGFTTFSSFSLENITLIQSGHIRTSMAYLLVSNGLGIGLAYAGFLLARSLARAA